MRGVSAASNRRWMVEPDHDHVNIIKLGRRPRRGHRAARGVAGRRAGAGGRAAADGRRTTVARGLFTGLLTLAPGASIPYHARPAAEAMVLLEGDAAVDVEDRRYRLGPLDAIAVRPGGRAAWRTSPPISPPCSTSRWPSAAPEQNWINGRFVPAEQPPAATGHDGVRARRPPRPGAPSPSSPLTRCSRTSTTPSSAPDGICGGYGLF